MSETIETMRIATAVATEFGRSAAAGDLCAEIVAQMDGRRVDLCTLFASAHFENDIERVSEEISDALRPRAFIGATAEGVIHSGVEFEHAPAMTLFAAHLPSVGVRAFHVSQDDLQRVVSADELPELLGIETQRDPSFLLLGDPYSIDVLRLIDLLGEAYPGRPAVGGMASAAERPGQNRLVFDGQTLRQGLVGVGLWGNVRLDAVVSQGCKPIGRRLIITRGEGNIIQQLGGKPAWTAINEVLGECDKADIELARTRGLLVGRVINENQGSFGRGDFLIRNPIGIDSNSGALTVNDFVRTGQTVQFHVRDGHSAAEDLRTLLAGSASPPPAGALLFSCNGRGTRMFSERNHDARTVAGCSGAAPLAGFFCAGEIGPVGRRNFLHGFTASIAFFRPAGA